MRTLAPGRTYEPLARFADRRAVAAAAAGGLAFDVALQSRMISLGGALAGAATATALVVGGRIQGGPSRFCAANAAVFGAFLAVRSSDWLAAIDLLVVTLSLTGVVLLRGTSRLDDVGLGALLGRALGGLRPILTAPVFLAGPLFRLLTDGEHAGRRATLGRATRGLLLAVPVVVVLGALLASADAVFASFARVDHLLPAELWLHLGLVGVGTLLAGGLLHAAATPPAGALSAPGQVLGAVEWTVILGSVVALFSAFAAAQLVALSEGGRRVLATEGLTYAEYARTGYFQLLVVAVLAAALLVGLGAVADRSTAGVERRFRILGGAAVLLTLVVLAVAVRRLGLYEDAYGWTMLRLMVKASAVWLALSFVLLGLRIAGVGAGRQWLLPAVTAAALMIALTLNLANPEAAVVRHNVERGAAGHEVDPGYLVGLSDDAIPALVDVLPRLDSEIRAGVVSMMCSGRSDHPGLTWNLAASRADEARGRICL